MLRCSVFARTRLVQCSSGHDAVFRPGYHGLQCMVHSLQRERCIPVVIHGARGPKLWHHTSFDAHMLHCAGIRRFNLGAERLVRWQIWVRDGLGSTANGSSVSLVVLELLESSDAALAHQRRSSSIHFKFVAARRQRLHASLLKGAQSKFGP